MNITDRIKKQALIEDIYLAYKVHDWDKVDELYSQLLLKGFYDKTAEILYEGACRYRMVTQLSQKQETINKSYGEQIATNPLCGTIQIQEEQNFCIKDLISAAYDYETVSVETAGKKLVEFNRKVYDTYMSPMAKEIEGTGLDYTNVVEETYIRDVKARFNPAKSFEQLSKEEKVKLVNKEIDELIEFCERPIRERYKQWEKNRHYK